MLTLFLIMGCYSKKSDSSDTDSSFVGNYTLNKLIDQDNTYTAKDIKKINNSVITLEVRENNIMILTTKHLDSAEDNVINYVYDDNNIIYNDGLPAMNFEYKDSKITITSSNYTYVFKKD